MTRPIAPSDWYANIPPMCIPTLWQLRNSHMRRMLKHLRLSNCGEHEPCHRILQRYRNMIVKKEGFDDWVTRQERQITAIEEGRRVVNDGCPFNFLVGKLPDIQDLLTSADDFEWLMEVTFDEEDEDHYVPEKKKKKTSHNENEREGPNINRDQYDDEMVQVKVQQGVADQTYPKFSILQNQNIGAIRYSVAKDENGKEYGGARLLRSTHSSVVLISEVQNGEAGSSNIPNEVDNQTMEVQHWGEGSSNIPNEGDNQAMDIQHVAARFDTTPQPGSSSVITSESQSSGTKVGKTGLKRARTDRKDGRNVGMKIGSSSRSMKEKVQSGVKHASVNVYDIPLPPISIRDMIAKEVATSVAVRSGTYYK